MSDPWLDKTTGTNTNNIRVQSDTRQSSNIFGFEDNFCNSSGGVLEGHTRVYQPLPESKEYLQGLERKLEKLKKGSKLVDALSEKREDCLRSLLQNTEIPGDNFLLELEENITNPDSVLQNIQRFIQPMQPATLGEIVDIIKYDHLQQQRFVDENEEQEEEEKEDRISR